MRRLGGGMNISWLLALFIFSQQVNMTDNLFVTNQGQTISVVNRSEFSIPLPGISIINMKKYQDYMNQLDYHVSSLSKDATIDKHGNIIPEQVGYRLHHETFTKKFYTYFYNSGPSQLEIPLLPVYPRVDSELLENIRIKRIGRYVTSFNANNKKRTHNIHLAANAINNYVIFPGENFSFNKVVGKRTAKKGYLRAPVIVRGELSEDIGGGICQVSSTLFNAVDSAGLKIIQRFSHSRKVPYIPPGRDATVSWYGPDFIFMNNYNQPILIQAKTLGNHLIIKLFSSEVIEYTPRKVPYLPY